MAFNLNDLHDYGGNSITTERGTVSQPETIEGRWNNIQFQKILNESMRTEGEVEEYIQLGTQAYNEAGLDLYKMLNKHILDRENDIYIVDDHQHALTGWLAAYGEGILEGESTLVHVDRHYDLNQPEEFSPPGTITEAERDIADGLKNDEFIYPALQWNLVDEVKEWGVEDDIKTTFFKEDLENNSMILDIDLDVFQGISKSLMEKSEDPYHSFSREFYETQINYFYDQLAELIRASEFTTIATSPGYIHQDTARMHLGNIMERYEEKKN